MVEKITDWISLFAHLYLAVSLVIKTTQTLKKRKNKI